MLRSQGIEPGERVYVNWSQFTDVDEVRFADLDTYFDEFWYPAANDIDIVDRSFRWMASVDYYGVLWITRAV